MKQKLLLSLLLFPFLSFAGKIEVINGAKSEFYNPNGSYFNVAPGLDCAGDTNIQEGHNIVFLNCKINGTGVENFYICNSSNGAGMSVLTFNLKSNKRIQIKHHCNGLTLGI